MFAAIRGQRTEQIIHQQYRGVAGSVLGPAQHSVNDSNSSAGRCHVDMVRFDGFPLSCFRDGHFRLPRKQFRKHAGLAPVQMRDDDERHTRVFWHGGKEFLKRLETPADAPIPTIGNVALARPGSVAFAHGSLASTDRSEIAPDVSAPAPRSFELPVSRSPFAEKVVCFCGFFLRGTARSLFTRSASIPECFLHCSTLRSGNHSSEDNPWETDSAIPVKQPNQRRYAFDRK